MANPQQHLMEESGLTTSEQRPLLITTQARNHINTTSFNEQITQEHVEHMQNSSSIPNHDLHSSATQMYTTGTQDTNDPNRENFFMESRNEVEVEDVIGAQKLHSEHQNLSEAIKSHTDELITLLKKADHQERFKTIERFNTLLNSEGKVVNAIDLVIKSRRQQREKKESVRPNNWLKQRTKVADKLLHACFGEESYGAGLESLFQQAKKHELIFCRTKSSLEGIQKLYTQIAASLYIRWNLTQRQYALARKLILHSGNLDVLNRQNTGKTKRLNLAQRDALIPMSMGIEMWPKIEVIREEVKRIESQIAVEPINVRTRGLDGRFKWSKEMPKRKRQKLKPMNEIFHNKNDGTLQMNSDEHHNQQLETMMDPENIESMDINQGIVTNEEHHRVLNSELDHFQQNVQ